LGEAVGGGGGFLPLFEEGEVVGLVEGALGAFRGKAVGGGGRLCFLLRVGETVGLVDGAESKGGAVGNGVASQEHEQWAKLMLKKRRPFSSTSALVFS
jgi:hypothetical protein